MHGTMPALAKSHLPTIHGLVSLAKGLVGVVIWSCITLLKIKMEGDDDAWNCMPICSRCLANAPPHFAGIVSKKTPGCPASPFPFRTYPSLLLKFEVKIRFAYLKPTEYYIMEW